MLLQNRILTVVKAHERVQRHIPGRYAKPRMSSSKSTRLTCSKTAIKQYYRPHIHYHIHQTYIKYLRSKQVQVLKFKCTYVLRSQLAKYKQCSILTLNPLTLNFNPLTLRREVGVKLTPDKLFNIQKWFRLIQTRFRGFYYLFIAFNLAHLVHVHADRGHSY